MNNYVKLCKLIYEVIDYAERENEKKKYDDIAPSIHLDEIATSAEIDAIQENKSLSQVMEFVEHYYDAVTHNFDHVTDSITIEDGSNLIKEVQSILLNAGDQFPEKVANFSKYR